MNTRTNAEQAGRKIVRMGGRGLRMPGVAASEQKFKAKCVIAHQPGGRGAVPLGAREAESWSDPWSDRNPARRFFRRRVTRRGQ